MMMGDLIRLSAAEPFPRQNTLPHDTFQTGSHTPRAGAVRTAEQLADELGLSVWSLKRWSKLYGKDAAVGPSGGLAVHQLPTRRAWRWRMPGCIGSRRPLADSATSLRKALGILGPGLVTRRTGPAISWLMPGHRQERGTDSLAKPREFRRSASYLHGCGRLRSPWAR